MKIAVPKDSSGDERRVALVPETAKRLVQKGHAVLVEKSAGEAGGFLDSEYQQVGAAIASSRDELFNGADVVVRIQATSKAQTEGIREGSLLIGLLYPMLNRAVAEDMAARRISAIALDLIPRTSLAQSMDVLSSQASAAGYWCALHAAHLLPKFFPMLMTAAGTITPARVVVVGAGVAGLQAIATCRRLGAVVEAFDVRRVAKQDVESLGARFIEVDEGKDFAGEGGYAKETSDEYKHKQAELLATHLSKADACITTALIPGRRAPVIVTSDMVERMKPGSVIIDLAAEQGGNCAVTEPGKDIVKQGVLISGPLNIPSRVAYHASQMFSRNVEKLLLHITGKEGLKLDMADEIVRGCLITKDGEIVHPKVKEAAAGGTS